MNSISSLMKSSKCVFFEKAISDTAASFAMEDIVISDEYKNLCKRVLDGEITIQQYIETVKQNVIGEKTV